MCFQKIKPTLFSKYPFPLMPQKIKTIITLKLIFINWQRFGCNYEYKQKKRG